MKKEEIFTIGVSETIVFHELKFTLTSITREIIPADLIDESIPEGTGIFITCEFNLDEKKKTTKFSIMSEPYESVNQQTLKNYKVQIRKVNEESVKVKIYYT